jgi:hypothetical protein
MRDEYGRMRAFVIAGLLGALVCGGCTLVEKMKGVDLPDIKPPVEKPAPAELPAVKWLGKDYSGARETVKLAGAQTEGRSLYTQYENYAWPEQTVGDARCDAICCFFYEVDGGITGGKFDWWRKGGQAMKGLENVHNGYGGHRMPPGGTKCWTMIVSVDGRERSNLQAVEWR